MKEILIILLMTTGEVAIVPDTLEIGEWCSDKVEQHIKYVENPNYVNGNGEPWMLGYYKTKVVGATWCESIDRKYYISYNAGEPCEKKSLLNEGRNDG